LDFIAGFIRGDRVWYRQTCRGGYGFERDVPAVFLRRTLARATIDVELLSGGSKRIVVHPKNLRRRDGE
jgi:hypothetical protein